MVTTLASLLHSTPRSRGIGRLALFRSFRYITHWTIKASGECSLKFEDNGNFRVFVHQSSGTSRHERCTFRQANCWPLKISQIIITANNISYTSLSTKLTNSAKLRYRRILVALILTMFNELQPGVLNPYNQALKKEKIRVIKGCCGYHGYLATKRYQVWFQLQILSSPAY